MCVVSSVLQETNLDKFVTSWLTKLPTAVYSCVATTSGGKYTVNLYLSITTVGRQNFVARLCRMIVSLLSISTIFWSISVILFL